MKIHLHQNDLPDGLHLGNLVAVDTEAMGLKPHRDRLCLVQLSAGDGICHLVQFPQKRYQEAHNLKQLLADPGTTKIFHFARFDVMILFYSLGIMATPLYCTKIASKLIRTFTEKHSLKDLCKELLAIEISKQEQTSDWGAPDLTPDQLRYAATDVLHLHPLKDKLDALLERENQTNLAEACFSFLPHRATMDLTAGEEFDIFQH
ncbi:MAG: 3-5 exonuclease [Alphaproteobacteria bacterium]|jgi:ribonuclease D|nr:3-5 exonuclease [Alphaproteobacteria bacterium]